MEHIKVGPLVKRGKPVLPAVWLDSDIQYTLRNRAPLSALEHQIFGLPTLAELRHSFFDADERGYYVSTEYRDKVLAEKDYGEWTATFIQPLRKPQIAPSVDLTPVKVIHNPYRVYWDERHRRWTAEYDYKASLECTLPPEGWIYRFDELTGLPTATSLKKDKALEVFGQDASYFWKWDTDSMSLRAVCRKHDSYGYGPFSIYTLYEPGERHPRIGSRSCHRSEEQVNLAHIVTDPSNDPLEQQRREVVQLLTKLKSVEREIGDILTRIQPSNGPRH